MSTLYLYKLGRTCFVNYDILYDYDYDFSLMKYKMWKLEYAVCCVLYFFFFCLSFFIFL